MSYSLPHPSRFASLFVTLVCAAGASDVARAAVPPDGTYRLVSSCSGKVLEILGGSSETAARAKLWSWEGEQHQKWQLESLGDGTHRLVAVHSGKVLDASSLRLDDGVPVFHQYPWHGGANQRFRIEEPDERGSRLIVQHNGKAVDVRRSSDADGATIQQWASDASCAQRWRFEPLDGGGGVPVAIQIVAGDNQTAVVGTTLPVQPALKVLDSSGAAVAGWSIRFRVIAGGGSVTGAEATTDARGIATVGSWKLGDAAGTHKLAASASGLPEAVFTATATAPNGIGTLARVAGTDRQSATVGTPVANAPAVIVRDSADAPVAGVTISFAVTGGSGSLAATSAVSDAAGRASAGRWTLGSVPGTNTVRADADGYTGIDFRATALAPSAPSVEREVFLRDVREVWDMAFTPDGVMLFTERGLGLSVRMANGSVRRLFAPADLVTEDQSGMLGVAVDPAFASNRRVYVYMASNASGVRDNRVIRLRVDADYGAVADRADIVTGISYQRGAQYSGRHSGGDIEFGADRRLYITTGDTRTGSVPQDLRALGGKVLRVDSDGQAAAGNNAPTGADPRIYAWGFRNPQGLAMRPSGGVFLIEHGPSYDDEVTLLRAGGNGGWDPRPRPWGSADAACPNGRRLEYCGYEGARMTHDVLHPGAMAPTWRSRSPALGLASGDFVHGSAWKSWHGALVIATMAARRLHVLQLDASGNQVVKDTQLLDTLGERLRGVTFGPDGALYVSTSSDNNRNDRATEVWRLTPR